MGSDFFKFKQFAVEQAGVTWKVGVDGVLLGAWADVDNVRTILDAGAGTGLLSLMAAQRNPNAHVTAVEIDPRTAEVARRNFYASKWTDRLEVIQGNVLNPDLLRDIEFDLVISNPPYFPDGLKPGMRQRQLARAGDEFHAFSIGKLAETGLTYDGRISMIIPYDRADPIVGALGGSGKFLIRRCDVRHNEFRPFTRSLMEFGSSAQQCEHDRITLYHGDTATSQYRLLLEPFQIV